MKSSRTKVIGGVAVPFAVVIAAMAPSATWAQSDPHQYPARPIRIVVPFAPGGSVEVEHQRRFQRPAGRPVPSHERHLVLAARSPPGF